MGQIDYSAPLAPASRISCLTSADFFSPAALSVVGALEDAGFETWFVGGCIRSAAMGLPAADIDITTAAPWQEVKTVCEGNGMAVFETGTKHGTVTVCAGDQRFEVTTFRVDGTYSDGRRPDSVRFTRSLTEDLARRDFTMNAMAWHPVRGLCDPFGGLDDIERGEIRVVGDGDIRFEEDALRILRGCRFVSQLGFSLDAATKQSMDANRHLLAGISAERIFAEMDKLIAGPFAKKALMECSGILAEAIPEIAPCICFQQHNPHHIYDVWKHTATAIGYASDNRMVRWALLFHDLGKPAVFSCDDAGIGHFYGHERVSADIAAKTLQRLRAPKYYRETVPLLVAHHDSEIKPTAKSVKRLLIRIGGDADLFRELLEVKRCDRAASAPPYDEELAGIDAAEQILEEILAQGQTLRISDLAINGSDLMAKGLPEGPAVGVALKRALDGVLDEAVANDADALLEYLGLR